MKKLYLHLNANEQASLFIDEIKQSIEEAVATNACVSDVSGDSSLQVDGTQISCLSDATLLGSYGDRLVYVVGDESTAALKDAAAKASALIHKHGHEAFLNSEYASFIGDGDALIGFDNGMAGMSLLLQAKMKPLVIDFEQISYRQRLLRGGRQKEPLARAVMNGIEDGALVFDATAGLGRESMILAHAKAQVLSFERQLPIWIILKDALMRASKSRFFPFTLPKLQAIGTIASYVGEAPEVIYYDPMFPEREKSAVVKKDMFLFRQVIGEDKDIEDFIRIALKLATKRVVVKRPSTAEPVSAVDIQRAYFVDGGQCRFDCYKP